MNFLLPRRAVRNRLLGAMDDKDFADLVPHLRLLELPFGMDLETPGEPIDRVVFVESGIASRLITGRHGEFAESGHVGFEGLVGRPVILGSTKSTNLVRMQVSGTGLAVRAGILVDAMETSHSLKRLLSNYVLFAELQAEHTLLAATNYNISQRLARWLLMYHDRVDGEDFPVTHRLLAEMMNVRRAGVTEAIHLLEGKRAIRSSRGRVSVVDRKLLERLSGGSYGMPEAFYEDLFPVAAKVDDVSLSRELANTYASLPPTGP